MANKQAGRAKRVSKREPRAYQPEELKDHHAKPYRKRHYGLLIISLLSFIGLAYLFTSTSISNSAASRSAKNLLKDIFNSSVSTDQKTLEAEVSSTYGFTFSYDQLKLYASAVDAQSGDLYIGQELDTKRAYNSIRLAPNISDKTTRSAAGSIIIQYHSDKPVPETADLTKLETDLVAEFNKAFTKASSATATIDGKSFLQSEWQSKPQSGVAASFSSKFTSYTGVINSNPMTVILNRGLISDDATSSSLAEVVSSIKFGDRAEQASLDFKTLAPASSAKLSLFDKLTFTDSASAAVPNTPNSSERTSTLYGPAVVKIFNVYCMDILMNGQPYLVEACGGSTGSGFFVGSKGYIATNGHVAATRPLDIVIMNAFTQSANGDNSYLSDLAQASGLTQADLIGATTNQQKLAIMAEKFYAIQDSVFTPTNEVSNLLVNLTEKQPNTQELLNSTKNRKKYPEQETIKRAELMAYDYRVLDGSYTGIWKSLDVAILKVEGSGYPAVKLGSVNSLSQGSGLSIIGYPGAAGDNALVDATQSKATLTSGKVSSIKNAAGSENKLIETDATVGHGNSGGPAFSDNGEVVGIATYTIDGSGVGNGVFSYVRDIADLSSLASINSLEISGTTDTQTEWEKGVNLFYEARYSKAIKNFAQVKALYPQHPEVAKLIGLAQQRIDAGEEVKDFPLFLVAGGSALAGLLVVLTILIILKHKKKHQAYKDHVASGQITSLQPNTAPTPVAQQASTTPTPISPVAPLAPLAPSPPATPTEQQAPTIEPPVSQV